MMMASMMGAIAFQKDLGAVHSCAHALGAVCDLHHGLANALMIDTVLAWNHEAVPEKFDELAHVCKVSGGGAEFVPWLRALKARIGITGKLAAHGVQARADPAAGGDRGGRHLPPDQSAALHARRISSACSRRRCRMHGDGQRRPPEDRHLGLLHARRPGAAAVHRQDPAVRRAVDRALGHVHRRAGRDDSQPDRRHAARRRHAGPLRAVAGRPGAARRRRRLAAAATASSRCRSAGPATRSATSTRSTWWPPSSATASRCSASAAACSCSTWPTAARCTRTSRPSCPRPCSIATPRSTTSTSTPWTSCPARGWRSLYPDARRVKVNSIHHQAHQGPGARLRGRGGQQRGRPDRGDPAQRRRQALSGGRAMAPRIPPARLRHHRRRGAAGGFPRRRARPPESKPQLMSQLAIHNPANGEKIAEVAGRRRGFGRRQGRRARAPRSRPGPRARWPSARPASRAFAKAWCATWNRWPRP